MTRKEILSSPEYWTADLQIRLYDCAAQYMEEHDMNRTKFAEHLGVSRSYVTQLLNGDFDHKLSKFVELSIACGFIPKISFEKIEDYINLQDAKSKQ